MEKKYFFIHFFLKKLEYIFSEYYSKFPHHGILDFSKEEDT